MIKIYGHSDDCIEIEGDICEEFDGDEEEGVFIAFSNGTVLKIRYGGDGEWRINQVVRGSTPCMITPPTGSEYTDVAVIEGTLSWFVAGTKFERTRKLP